jgi:hypothetical protein
MAFYYNGRGRNKTLTLKKVVGETEEVLNGSAGTYDNIPDSILAGFTAVDGTLYPEIAATTDPVVTADTHFAQLSTEAYMRRLADFVTYVKSLLLAEGETAFQNMNLTSGAEVMTGATGPVPVIPPGP